MRRVHLIVLLLIFSLPTWASESSIHLEKAPINLNDKASLQRGAGLFVNYCLGCHSLQYIRYNRMAKGIGIVEANGQVNDQLVKDNLIFSDTKIFDPIRSAMPIEKAKDWFGVAPPDLTLIARVRGADWLYTYLRSFYKDPKRPWGTNNVLIAGVAMPNVLLTLQGEQLPVYKTSKETTDPIVDHLVLVGNGTMSTPQFNRAMADIVNFLAYVAEPERQERHYLGLWVIVYLLILLILLYSLKELYWKDLK
jgi:ubiquinol-cytochrome c reductase cytochrome c1 subunit